MSASTCNLTKKSDEKSDQIISKLEKSFEHTNLSMNHNIKHFLHNMPESKETHDTEPAAKIEDSMVEPCLQSQLLRSFDKTDTSMINNLCKYKNQC